MVEERRPQHIPGGKHVSWIIDEGQLYFILDELRTTASARGLRASGRESEEPSREDLTIDAMATREYSAARFNRMTADRHVDDLACRLCVFYRGAALCSEPFEIVFAIEQWRVSD